VHGDDAWEGARRVNSAYRIDEEPDHHALTSSASLRSEPLTDLDAGLQGLPEAALALDAAGRIASVNVLASELVGHRREELAGAPIERIVRDTGPLRALLAAREPVSRRIVRLEGRRADGVPFAFEASVAVAVDDEGCPGALCLLRELDHDDLAGDAQRHFDLAFDSAPIGMALFDTDGRYLRVNDALCALLGRERSELLGMRDQELTHPEDRQADLDAVGRILRGELAPWQCEKRFVRPDGAIVWTIASLTFLRDADGHPLSWFGQFQDITGHRDAEEALRHERDFSQTILGAMHEGFALTQDGEIVAVNDALCRLTGFERRELVGARAPFPFWPPELRAETAHWRDAMMAAGGGALYLRLMRKNGEHFEAEITAAPAGGAEDGAPGVVTTFRDVSDRRRQEAELARQASSDDLTGLLNRRAFEGRLAEEVGRAKHEDRPLSVALLDLDHFKAVNDAHGHPAGDRVLVAAAKRLRGVARAADHLARVGGEEFAWILPGTDAIDAFEAVERARHAIVDTPFGELGPVTLSIGLCQLADAGSAGELYRLADVALYAAKSRGRNRSVRHLPGA